MGEEPSAPCNYPNHGVTESKKYPNKYIRRDHFLCFYDMSGFLLSQFRVELLDQHGLVEYLG
jgi:hypothetical protein